MSVASRRALPGFRFGLGVSLVYLTLLVLIPLGAAAWKASELSGREFFAAVRSERALSAYSLTFSVSLQAAAINVVLGLITAWTLVRYEFPGKKIIDALVDVPFALPTAVAGLVFAGLYVDHGWFGQLLAPLGFQGAYSRTGIVLVLVFTGFPFVVRTVQPVLEEIDQESEQAATTLGADRTEVFRRVIFPVMVPPALTGFTLAFARAIGEYGSVIFISSNMPFETEIAPVLIVSRLEEFAYREASAIAVMLLAVSFALLVLINITERWSQPGAMPTMVRRLMYWPTMLVGGAAAGLFFGLVYIARLSVSRFGRIGRRPGRHLPWIWSTATVAILTVLVIVPLVNVFVQAFSAGGRAYWNHLVHDPDTRHAILLTLLVAPLAVAANTIFGIAAAYTIARFRFPGRTILTSLIDLPFSVSPVVAGLVFVLLFGLQTPFGMWLRSQGYQVIFAPPALVLVTAFVTFPFVARELIPVLEAGGPDEELAARSLGAGGLQMFFRITLPNIKWGLIYGIILCNARAMGEFGAIYVVSGRIGGETDTMPLRVEKLFQEYNQPAAFALASVLTLSALVTLVIKVAVESKLRADHVQRPAVAAE